MFKNMFIKKKGSTLVKIKLDQFNFKKKFSQLFGRMNTRNNKGKNKGHM